MIIRKENSEIVELPGFQVNDYGNGTDLSSSLAHVEVDPGARHPKTRSSRSDRYFYMLSGQLSGATDVQGAVALKAGDLWSVPCGEQWWYENTSDEPAVFVLCHTPALHLDAEEFED